MKIHILACGGAVMHNIAIALHKLGHQITGSDDEIFEPALSRLKSHGICPEQFGWFPEKINTELDFIILGMHARADNPELLKARELGLKIYSFPEYVFEHARQKTRIVIGGSHGKTTTTAMIMHVLKTLGRDFDYLVGSQLEGFDTMVKFSDAPVMVIEGDEYLTSTLDPVPKFLKYHPHFALITGIAWDHINVFPTFEGYTEQFKLFIDSIGQGGQLVYFGGDPLLSQLASESRVDSVDYHTPRYTIENGKVTIHGDEDVVLEIFGEHNLQNAEGARLICANIGISGREFYKALSSFRGTAKRLERVFQDEQLTIFRDFAHSPSKLKATVEAVRTQFAESTLMAVFELHTFSSLNKDFLPEYQHAMDPANEAIVYFNPHVFEHKKMQIIDKEDIAKNFGGKVLVLNDTRELIEKIENFKGNVSGRPRVLLLMSSGNFDNASLW
jgi:UDP-N-acetylmuramate: L-alanyl-gamma-D-glutamyl-meso-diaminopimelate ligase